MHAAIDHHIFRNFSDSVNNLFVFIKRNSVLAVIAKTHSLSDIKVSAVGRHNALQHFYKCRFPDAVLPYYAKFFISGESVVEVVEYYFVAEAFADIDRIKYF